MKAFGLPAKNIILPSSKHSAEQFVTMTLFGVCAVAGAGIFIASRGDHGDAATSSTAVASSTAKTQTAAAIDWQTQLDKETDRLGRARAQEQRDAEAALTAAQQRERERQDLDRRQRELAAQAAALAAASTKSARASSEIPSSAPPPKPAVAAAAPTSNLVAARIINDSCAPPTYPPNAERLQQEGQVVLGFQVDTQGRVLDQRVDKSSGYAQLDNAAIRALGRCRFTPATLDGAPQTAWTQVRFTWKLNR